MPTPDELGDSLRDSYPTLREPLRGTGTLRERTRVGVIAPTINYTNDLGLLYSSSMQNKYFMTNFMTS
jgi:hypothetical protein